uniref:Endo/exonuclease/phosphatase domain-containing protein n=1 Tax=Angiostrongylus cantonensis TaxID=6313 RepID=A0A0K0CXD1_ANGCA
MNIDPFEQPPLTIFVVYAPTSSYEKEEVEGFYMNLEKYYREDHTFKAITGDFNSKTGPSRKSEERHIGTHGLEWNEQGEPLSEFIMPTKTIHGNS